MCARSYLLYKYLHDDFGNGIDATKWDTSAPLRLGYGGVHKVHFPHTAAAVVPDSPQGTKWARKALYANFYLFGALGKNSQLVAAGVLHHPNRAK